MWNRRDPLGYVDGMGLALYVSNKPLNSVDSFGNQEEFKVRLPSFSKNCLGTYPDPPPGGSSPPKPREPYFHGSAMPEEIIFVFLNQPSKAAQLKNIPILRKPDLTPTPPTGLPELAGGGRIHESVLAPGQIIGVTGASPCVGVLLIPPDKTQPTYAIHFQCTNSPSRNMPVLPYYLAADYKAVLCGAEFDPDPVTNRQPMYALKSVISELKYQGIPIKGYVPAPGMAVDSSGNIIWTTPESQPTQQYEP